MDPSSADSIIATLDGKKPSAVEHELIKELGKPDGKFEPVCFGFADPAGATGSSTRALDAAAAASRQSGASTGSSCAGDSRAMPCCRSYGSWPPSLARGCWPSSMGPTFNKTSLACPCPIRSTRSSRRRSARGTWWTLIKQMAPSSAVKEQIDEIAESIRDRGVDRSRERPARPPRAEDGRRISHRAARPRPTTIRWNRC